MNPDAGDTLSLTRRLRLNLGFGENLKKSRPVADFVWFSEYPKVSILEHYQNPVSKAYQENNAILRVF